MSPQTRLTDTADADNRPPRAAPPQVVPFLRGMDASIECIERRVARARRDHTALALVAVALGPVTTADGTPAAHHAPALATEFTRRLRSRVRGADDLWQCAEDEWIAILANCRVEGARAAARRLAAALGAPYGLETGLLVTRARVGIATLGDDGDTGTGLLATAQAALDFEEARIVSLRGGSVAG